MDNFGTILLTLFGGIITLAIVSVVVSRKSNAPQAIQAIGGAISEVVASAVNPVSANYGYGNGGSSFNSPGNAILNDLTSSFATPMSIFPGASK